MSDAVRKQSKAVEEMAANWPLIDALLGGTSAMRAAGKQFLPQWPGEDDASYKTRLAIATLFPAFARTIDVLVGKPFSRQLTLGDDVPPHLAEWTENIDLQGRNIHAFAASICRKSLSHGLAGILVDYPKVDGIRTKAEEQKSGMRPYFIEIHLKDLLGWKSRRINGVETLTQLRFLETVVEDDGEFGEKEIEQVRVLYPGRWEVWRETGNVDADGTKIWIKHDEGLTSLQKIPFVPTYASRTGFMTAVPPLLELAHMNIEHYQSKSDQQTIMHVARVPILFGKMLGDGPITVGAASAVKADNPDAELTFVEHTGAAIDAGRLSILDIEDRMRQVGAELLVIKPGNTSVKQTAADESPGMCYLQRMVEDEEDAIDAALQLMAEWVGEKQGGHVQIFKDFGVSTLTEASADLLREMNVDGTISDETLFREMQRRGMIRAEINWEDEKKRISAQPTKEGALQLKD